MPSVYSPIQMGANQVPLTSPAFSHQLDAYAVTDRRRMLERLARPSTIASLGELQGLARPTVTAIARPGWETGAPHIFPLHHLVDFLGAPVPFFSTYNIENDNSNRVHFSRRTSIDFWSLLRD